MEDFYETRIDAIGGEVVGLFGVFDGKYYDFRSLHVRKAGFFAISYEPFQL